MAGSITAANSVLTLAIASLYPVPQTLVQYAADDIFSADVIEPVETQMGVDGVLAAGHVFVPIKQSITLMANSPSNAIFDAWIQAQRVLVDLYFAQGIVYLPSIGRKWVLTGGVLAAFPPIPDAGRVLKPRKYGIIWESVLPAPV